MLVTHKGIMCLFAKPSLNIDMRLFPLKSIQRTQTANCSMYYAIGIRLVPGFKIDLKSTGSTS